MSDWEQDFNKQRLEHLKGLTAEGMLRELLAHLHGDGGHHTEKVGLAKSVFDAEQRSESRPNETVVIGLPPLKEMEGEILEALENLDIIIHADKPMIGNRFATASAIYKVFKNKIAT